MVQEYINIPHHCSPDVFYTEVKKRIKDLAPTGRSMTLACLDFDNFNYVNDLFGYETGDLVLEKVAKHFSSYLQGTEIFSRLHADHFAFCLDSADSAITAQRFQEMTQLSGALPDTLPPHYSMIISGGIVNVQNDVIPLSALLDRANYARKKSKGRSTSSFQFYNQKMSLEVQWQKIVTCMMASSLQNREFEMYLQPKVLLSSDQIVGAEALVRWNNPEYGMIVPDRFIPIMEQNGFICQLDFFMLEEVCRFLKENAANQRIMLPISVNFLKAHLFSENLVERILETVSRAGIPTGLVEIEFTENLFTGDFERLIEVVSKLKQLGFRVSLDDFGSAYSSLNCLKELSVDMIKIDKGFLNSSTNTSNGRIIISKVIELIKSLQMFSVMEGIETGEQVEFLKKLNCDMGQGYFYAKPMPASSYLDYLQKGSVFSDLESYLSTRYSKTNGSLPESGPSEWAGHSTMPAPKDSSHDTGAVQGTLEDKIKELELLVAAERKAKETLRLSEERYRIIMEQSDDIIFDWDFASDQISFSEKHAVLFGMESPVRNLTSNTAIRSRIHMDDMNEFRQWLNNTYKKIGSSTAQYRVKDANGNYIWIRSRSTAICDKAGTPIKAVGVFSNINAQKKQMDLLTIKSQRDPLTNLLNKGETCDRISQALLSDPSQPGAFFIIDIDNFKELNDNLGHQLGDTVLVDIADKICCLFCEYDLIGRIGGDEFAVYMRSCSESEARLKAEQLGMALRASYYGSAKKYNISGSVGVALYPVHGNSFEELYRLADTALYESKHRGKDQFTVYQESMIGVLQDNRTPVDWSKGFLSAYFQSDFPFHIFQMLYETKDFRASIQMILEILGKQYHVDRVYIFQNEKDDIYLSNTYEWCSPGIEPQITSLQRIPIEILQSYSSQYNDEGILCCSDIRKLDPDSYAICAPQGIKSMLHCGIYNAGIMNGLIGFDMCGDYYNWTGEEIAILSYISRILSVFLIKTDTASELQTSYNNYVELLNNLNGYVYVIDPDTYEILYLNNATKLLGMTAGQPCYQTAFHADAPCLTCPVKKLGDTIHFATEEIYSEILNRWTHSAASKLKWKGVKEAVLICCTDISKYKAEAKFEGSENGDCLSPK